MHSIMTALLHSRIQLQCILYIHTYIHIHTDYDGCECSCATAAAKAADGDIAAVGDDVLRPASDGTQCLLVES